MKALLDFLIGIYRRYGTHFQGKLFNTVILLYKYSRTEKDKRELARYAFHAFPKVKVYRSGNKARAIQKLLKNVEFDFSGCNKLAYSIDVYKSVRLRGKVLGNCTVDYRRVLLHPLSDLYLNSDSEFASQNNMVLDAILEYVDRMSDELGESGVPNKENICAYLRRFRTERAESLEEAMQRVLVINQLQWQTGHILVGLGRLDLALDSFLTPGLSGDSVDGLVSEFCALLHKYYYVKSNALMGDTGQILILGGKNPDGSYFYNDLTRSFMKSIAKMGIPDPKILVWVSANMPHFLWEELAAGMTAKVGSPLISNDDLVVKELIGFRYEKEDAYNYITSACWEPISGGHTSRTIFCR